MLERLVLTWNGCDPKDWKLGIASCDHPEGESKCKAHVGKKAGGPAACLACRSVDESPRPLGRWTPHHNFAFPTVAFHRRVPNARRRLRFFATSGKDTETSNQLLELRQSWAALQNEILLELGEEPLAQSNAHWEFRKSAGQKDHWSRYFFRGFPWWPGKAQRVSYFGAFGCRVVRKLNEVEALGVSVGGPVACPKCGGPFIAVIGTTPTHYRAVSTGDP